MRQTDVHPNCNKLLHSRPSILDRTPTVIDPTARYLSRIAIFAYHTVPPVVVVLVRGAPRQNIAITFDTEKLEWCGYPSVKKLFISADSTNVTDGRTPHDGIGRAMYSIARQKKLVNIYDRRGREWCLRHDSKFYFGVVWSWPVKLIVSQVQSMAEA